MANRRNPAQTGADKCITNQVLTPLFDPLKVRQDRGLRQRCDNGSVNDGQQFKAHHCIDRWNSRHVGGDLVVRRRWKSWRGAVGTPSESKREQVVLLPLLCRWEENSDPARALRQVTHGQLPDSGRGARGRGELRVCNAHGHDFGPSHRAPRKVDRSSCPASTPCDACSRGRSIKTRRRAATNGVGSVQSLFRSSSAPGRAKRYDHRNQCQEPCAANTLGIDPGS